MNSRLLILLMTTILVFLGICLLYSKQIILPEGMTISQNRSTDGTMTFSVRTVTYNGPYAPRNAGVIWITNSSNSFVKTIKVWASNYRYTLRRWVASSGNNTTGAITSASLNSHQLHTVTWNAQNYQGTPVPDGNYTVNVEFTEHNATTSNLGKYKTVSFALGSTPVDTTPANESYFTNMHLVWAPVVSNGTISGTVLSTTGLPIQGATISAGTASATSAANGTYSISIVPGTYNVSCTYPDYISDTQNDVVVTSSQTTTVNFELTPIIVNGTLSGTVTNASSQPISGALITVGAANTTTNANGAYTLTLAAGTYNITCSLADYVSQTQSNIVIIGNQTTTVNFTMQSVANDDNSNSTPVILQQNYPNPFAGNTHISFYLKQPANATLKIYNNKGQIVASLLSSQKSVGWHDVVWNGKTLSGIAAAPGTYIYKLSVNGKQYSKTLTLTD